MASNHRVRRDIVAESSEDEGWELELGELRGGTSEWSPSHSTSYILLSLIKYDWKYPLKEVVSYTATANDCYIRHISPFTIIYCILTILLQIPSILATLAVLFLAGLLDRQRRAFSTRLATLPRFDHLLSQPFKHLLHILGSFGTRLPKLQLIPTRWIHVQLPKACPYSNETTLLTLRSDLLPTSMQLTFWLMDLYSTAVTCSFRHTSAPHSRNFLCQWYRRRWWSHWHCDSSCLLWCETSPGLPYPTTSSNAYEHEFGSLSVTVDYFGFLDESGVTKSTPMVLRRLLWNLSSWVRGYLLRIGGGGRICRRCYCRWGGLWGCSRWIGGGLQVFFFGHL